MRINIEKLKEIQKSFPLIRGFETTQLETRIYIETYSENIGLLTRSRIIFPLGNSFKKNPPVVFVTVKPENAPRLGENGEARIISTCLGLIDMLLEHQAADAVIGDLEEQYPRRLLCGTGYAKRWLVAQTFRILCGRALDLYRHLVRTRAGK